MKNLSWSFRRPPVCAPVGFAAMTAFALTASTNVADAKPGKRNLSAALKNMSAPAASARLSAASASTSPIQASTPMLMNARGEPLVKITLKGNMTGSAMVQALQGMQGVQITATDMNYRNGVIEAYVAPGMLDQVAGHGGVLSVVPSSPAVTNVGAVDTQAVIQHRVDQIQGVDGSGITIGVLSDSYDTNGAVTTAAADIATGDLPGAGNPLGNTEPVTIIEELPGSGIDEGRAMLQLIHDIAPKAKLGFATAFTGQVGFASNIRALAGFAGEPNTVPGFAADVIVDDIIYFAEPFFQDGIIAQAADDVAAAGVSYFSSAGNRPATQAYDAPIRIVPADPSTWANTNLDFTNVPPELYAGGFHNFSEAGVDIAQTIRLNNRGTITFQWNEPFDPVPPTPIRTITSGSGNVPASDTFTFNGTAGEIVEVFIDADNSNGNPNPDLTFTFTDPNGNDTFIDTGTNPESLTLELPATGTYTVVVAGFLGATGDYIYRVTEVQVVEQVLTDFNLLWFLEDGTFALATAEQNTFTNEPIELQTLNVPGAFNLQLVIARANVPTGKKRERADRLRYVWFTSGEPQEYYSYLGPVTFGHNSAAGAMGVAAYPFFAPFVPEGFSSPGPSTIYFDRNNNRKRRPEIRQKPDIAAMDGANNTFFGGDSSADPDTFPNFFGTSAAAPHAAAIAALVLDAAGGPGSVSPRRMRRILQRSAFPHDLDPYFSSAGVISGRNKLFITATGDSGLTSQLEPNFFSLMNFGRTKLASFTINGARGNTTQTPNGIVFDERVGPGNPFTIGETLGVDAKDITGAFSIPALPPGVAGQWQQLELTFATGVFGPGATVFFGTDRDEFDVAGAGGAVGGNSADLLGGGTLIPSGTIVHGGAIVTGTFENGRTFAGEFKNDIGFGYSQLDGYGFIDAERAVRSVQRRRRH